MYVFTSPGRLFSYWGAALGRRMRGLVWRSLGKAWIPCECVWSHCSILHSWVGGSCTLGLAVEHFCQRYIKISWYGKLGRKGVWSGSHQVLASAGSSHVGCSAQYSQASHLDGGVLGSWLALESFFRMAGNFHLIESSEEQTQYWFSSLICKLASALSNCVEPTYTVLQAATAKEKLNASTASWQAVLCE